MRQPVTETDSFDSLEEAALELGLLGPLEIRRKGFRLELTGPKRRALLILLALNAGSPVSRDRAIEALWPGLQTGREESTLRVHISHLRDVLEPIRESSPSVLVTRGSAYMLNTENLDLDIARFDRLTREAQTLLTAQPDSALGLLNEALGLWRGRPLEDVEYEEFAQEEIRRLEIARMEAIEHRAEALVGLGEDAAAIEDLEALVRAHPTRENPVRLLMGALYRTGRHADSLRIARRHARQLAEQGLEASPQITLLEERILRHDPALLSEAAGFSGDLKPGRSIRGYELRQEAGSGSVGVVYRAFQSSVAREVAIKVVHPHLAETPEFVRRFAEEARVVAGLEHPHIVPLYDFWREPAGAFMVMRWMDGGSLGQRFAYPWKLDDLGMVFGQLADALAYAHSTGIVHRDIKPANVLFDASGNAYVSDFSLAVAGIDTRPGERDRPAAIQSPYSPPELIRGEGPTVASDVFALGVLLAQASSGGEYRGGDSPVEGEIREVAKVATAPNPADRYPDMQAFRSALQDAVGSLPGPVPRRVRRNPYKGLAPFEEKDRADFYGREDVTETLLDLVGRSGLTAVIGASGSGKSSVVLAGLVPELRDGALPGSDQWSIVYMVPGTDPFDEFLVGLRAAAVGYPMTVSVDQTRELRDGFNAALDGPSSRALLIVDQFEELFSSQVDEGVRQRFLDNLLDLALDLTRRVRVVVTLRADFSDRPLAHPQFGDLMAKASVLLAPMRPEQVEDVIRRPAARVGMQVEPGLIAEIVRDIAAAPAYLPLLQYVLSELFERRTENRLTVRAYRGLGGVQGVLERRAEAIFSSLGTSAQSAARQLLLRMVHLGEQGEETRRRLPLTELRGLGGRAEVDRALEAFSAARLLTYDRDPVTRTPTVEVAHETVIHRWARYHVWIDEARAALLAHRRLSAAASIWLATGEDPSYLLTGGPLAAAIDVSSVGELVLNELEARYVSASQKADEAAREAESERQRQGAVLAHRARMRLIGGMAAALAAGLIAVVAGLALVERQRADQLASAIGSQNLARELAAASVANLSSGDHQLSLLLALAGADETIKAGDDIIPEVVDALHQAVINPRPDHIIEGAGIGPRAHLLAYSLDGKALVALAAHGGVLVIEPIAGSEMGEVLLPDGVPAAFGVGLHPDGQRLITVHPDGVRQWEWSSGTLSVYVAGANVAAAAYSPDGSLIAIGHDDGLVSVWRSDSGELEVELTGQSARVATLEFDPAGRRLISGASDGKVMVWDLDAPEVAPGLLIEFILPILQVAWHPVDDHVLLTTGTGEIFLLDANTGERRNSYGNAQVLSRGVAFDPSGRLFVTASDDGFARMYGTGVGGEPALALPAGGVPVRDSEFDPTGSAVATLGLDGRVRIWRRFLGSELPEKPSLNLYPRLAVSADGQRYAFGGHQVSYSVSPDEAPTIEVVKADTGEKLVVAPTYRHWDLDRSPALSADGSMVAFAGPTGDVEILEVETGARVLVGESTRWTSSLAFDSEAGLLAGAGIDGSIKVWNVATGDLITHLDGHGDRAPSRSDVPRVFSEGLGIFSVYTVFRVDQVVFRPGMADLASIGFDGTVRVWDLPTGQNRILHQFDYSGASIAYSPDGGLIAAADTTGTVVVLDGHIGRVVDRLEKVPGGTNLVFSPDGRFLAGAGPGPVVHLWDVETGRVFRRFQGAIYPPTSVGFTNDGTELWAAGGEGILRGYVLDPLRLVEIAREQVARQLTEEECRQYLGEHCDS